jgi:hypothetical protein
MLLRTFLVLAFIGALAEAVVHGAAMLATAALHQRAVTATRALLAAQIAAAQHAIAAGGGTMATPLPLATCAYADAGGCALYGSAIATPATPAPGVTPGTCPQTDCTIYLQSNSAVNESRITYHLSAAVTAPGGATLATRDGDVTFRTFSAPPYAVLSGSLDATLDALEGSGIGDDGGAAVPNGSTLITVQYQAQGGGPTASGNAWQPQEQHPATQKPAWDH